MLWWRGTCVVILVCLVVRISYADEAPGVVLPFRPIGESPVKSVVHSQMNASATAQVAVDSSRGVDDVLQQGLSRGERGLFGRPGFDLYQPVKFENAFRFPDTNVFIKPGGYVKADAIHDFNSIESTDNFVVSSIRTSGANRTNTRFHARQTRLNLDTRWPGRQFGPVRVFVEGDFFSDGDRFRLRHAYGELGSFKVGQTWTTFTDVSALPTTLDLESSVAFVARRQGQIRYTIPLFVDGLTASIAAEDPVSLIIPPEGVTGEASTPLPDFVTRVRYEREEKYGVQLALVVRKLGFQPTGRGLISKVGWGLNLSGHRELSNKDNFLFQVVGGQGIGSYWGVPDAAPSAPLQDDLLPIIAWMVGFAHNWTDKLTTNVTYSRTRIKNTAFQPAHELHSTEYLAVNLIWSPVERVFVGVEYLYGTRVDVDRNAGSAQRVQFSVGWYLP